MRTLGKLGRDTEYKSNDVDHRNHSPINDKVPHSTNKVMEVRQESKLHSKNCQPNHRDIDIFNSLKPYNISQCIQSCKFCLPFRKNHRDDLFGQEHDVKSFIDNDRADGQRKTSEDKEDHRRGTVVVLYEYE